MRTTGLVALLTIRRYERYERVDQGDFNWLTPFFIALASPQHQPIAPIPETSPDYAAVPTTPLEVRKSDKVPSPFKNVLCHFAKRNVGLVVRLNSELYSPTYFTALGISHLDMIFDDGTCPPLHMVKKFIRLAHEMITIEHKSIAVHCKAGLGRTGCLIGAYLIYRYGFTANECISFMRFMRPGMVVGPQQHWLHLNQGVFREWWYEDLLKQKLATALPTTPTKSIRRTHASIGQTATPPNASQSGKRSALGEINYNETAPSNNMDENLPAPTPGQPRKTGRIDSRHHPYARTTSGAFNNNVAAQDPENQLVEMHSHRKSQSQVPGENDEEWELRVLNRRTSSKSPQSSEKKRAISYTTTTTSTTRYSTTGDDKALQDLTSDVENWTHHDGPSVDKPTRPKTPASSKSGNGSGTIGVTKIRGNPVRRSAESREVKNGVRKTSGRIGSANGLASSRSRS